MVEKKKVDFQKQGKRNRARGGEFERRVRLDLEENGWIVNKWMNNVDLSQEKIVPAKRRFNPFSKVMAIGTGFPDFICFRSKNDFFEVILLEVKKNGCLDKEEKAKAKWYLEKGIVKEILVAQQAKEGRKIKIEYKSFLEKYPKMCE